MKVLFIQGGSRVRVCKNGNLYIDGNFNYAIWDRYKKYCDKLTVILRKINDIYEEEQIEDTLNYIDRNIIDVNLVEDIYSPKKNFFKIRVKKNIKKIISEEVKKSDKVIIRSLGNYYTNTALKYCIKYKKDYLIEVTGFAFESLWYHSILGKIVSVYREIYIKRRLRKAPYVVYVTNTELQKRYYSKGEMIGCSDVELFKENNVLEQKQKKILKDFDNNKIIIGTSGFLDVKFKGQQDVIKAINYLGKKGINNIYYEMIGTGDGKRLKKMIAKYKLNDRIKINGPLRHDDVKNWIMNLDIYIHPSYSEGLCRSIIEAMGLATPIICSNAGGNVELISGEYIYKKKKWKQLAKLLEKLCQKERMLEQSKINYDQSRQYEKELLDKKRDSFYKEFIKK